MSRSPLFCMFLAIIVAVTPSVAVAAEEGFDPALLTEDTVVAGLAFPHRILHAPGMELIPHEILKVGSMEQMGIDFTTIDQVQLAVEKFTPGAPPNFGVKIVFQQPIDLAAFLERTNTRTASAEYNGKTYQRIDQPSPITVGLYQPDKTVLVLGTEPVLQRVIDGTTEGNQAIASALLKQGSKNDLMLLLSLDPMRPMIQMGMAQSPPLPPQLEQFKKIPDLISMVMLRVNVSGEGPSGLTIAAHDRNEAEALEKLIQKALDIGKAQMFAEMLKDQNLRQHSPAMQQAMRTYMKRMTDSMFGALAPTRKGRILALEREGGLVNAQAANMAVIGILVSLLLPAVQSARTAARRAQSANNLRNFILAQRMDSNQNKDAISRAIMSQDGKPLLSWRVALLPYLEMNHLYKAFHLDEPWDSPHNIKLLSKMPSIYRSPNSKAGATKTNYLLPVGEGTLFPQYDVASFAPNVRDGTSNTILFVEADDSHAVPWTKPADYDVKDLPKGLGNLYPGGFNAAFADGHVDYIPNDAEFEWLRAVFTRDGAESAHPPGRLVR